jgi:hypothetical protein
MEKEIAIHITEIQIIFKDYNEHLYGNKMENLEEINTFMDTYIHFEPGGHTEP